MEQREIILLNEKKWEFKFHYVQMEPEARKKADEEIKQMFKFHYVQMELLRVF